MKKINPFILQISLSPSRKFHHATKISAFTHSKTPLSSWPDSWKVVAYKAYPRFPQVLLPKPNNKQYDFVNLLLKRRSTRDYQHIPISRQELSDLLYFSAGMKQYLTNQQSSTRFYPSAGGRYPLEVYPFIFNIVGMHGGGYHYHVKTHSLERLFDDKTAAKIYKCIDQSWIKNASVLLVITAIFDRTEEKYGSRGYRHILTEYGHLAQNFYLMTTALGLECCSIGGFVDNDVNRLLDIDFEDEGVIGLIAVGKKKL